MITPIIKDEVPRWVLQQRQQARARVPQLAGKPLRLIER